MVETILKINLEKEDNNFDIIKEALVNCDNLIGTRDSPKFCVNLQTGLCKKNCVNG